VASIEQQQQQQEQQRMLVVSLVDKLRHFDCLGLLVGQLFYGSLLS